MENSSRNQLRAWQVEAIQEWEKSERGIIVAATGTGKTRVGLEVAKESLSKGKRVLIVVPTIALAHQWESKIRLAGLSNPRLMGVLGGGGAGFRPEHRLVLAVLDSAKEKGESLIRIWKSQGSEVTAIFDECHNLKANECLALLNSGFDASVGLSATPSSSDGTFEELLTHSIGPVIYELTLRRALDDGLIGPLRMLDVYFDLKNSELHEFRIQSSRFNVALSELKARYPEVRFDSDLTGVLSALSSNDQLAKHLLSTIAQTGRLVAGSVARHEALEKFVSSEVLGERKTIFFNDSIASAEKVFALLRSRGFTATMDHSRLTPSTRKDALRKFDSGGAQCLVAVRTIDEGIDVPDAELAVIAGGSVSQRQRVQRIGRVLRPATPARVISLLARGTNEEFLIGARDSGLIGSERLTSSSLEGVDEVLPWLFN